MKTDSMELAWIMSDRTFRLGLILLLLLILVVVVMPLMSGHDPLRLGVGGRGDWPSVVHYFGTDLLGRDLFARVAYGAHASLLVGLLVTLVSVLIGTAIGIVSGYVRWLDGFLMRLMDAFMSIPSILLAIALVTLFGGSLMTVVMAITVAEFPRVARLVRGEVLSARDRLYVEAALTAGVGPARLMAVHIFPGIVAPLVVQATYVFAHAILLEAGLSFIGAGVPVTIPTWGNIMAEGKLVFQIKPFLIFFPAAFLSVIVIVINMFGDALRDRFDPRLSNSMH